MGKGEIATGFNFWCCKSGREYSGGKSLTVSSLGWRNRVWVVMVRALLLGVAWREPKLSSTCNDDRTRAGTSWNSRQMLWSSWRIHHCDLTITKRSQSISAWVQPRLSVATRRDVAATLKSAPSLLHVRSMIGHILNNHAGIHIVHKCHQQQSIQAVHLHFS